MKSIKEKAEEYGLQYPVIHYDADGNTYDDVDKPSMDFEAGANYVLEEIEKALDLGEPPYLISTEQAYYKVNNLIKELKRE